VRKVGLEDSLLQVVRLDGVALRYGISCEVCGSQVAMVLDGLEVRVIEEGGSYVAIVQLPLPGDYLDEYLEREYLRRYCLFLNFARAGILAGARYELREDIPSLVARADLGNLGNAVKFVETLARVYGEARNRC
jgi:hypothetical protein